MTPVVLMTPMQTNLYQWVALELFWLWLSAGWSSCTHALKKKKEPIGCIRYFPGIPAKSYPPSFGCSKRSANRSSLSRSHRVRNYSPPVIAVIARSSLSLTHTDGFAHTASTIILSRARALDGRRNCRSQTRQTCDVGGGFFSRGKGPRFIVAGCCHHTRPYTGVSIVGLKKACAAAGVQNVRLAAMRARHTLWERQAHTHTHSEVGVLLVAVPRSTVER